uniref:MAM domain-containing protein n=1 Tax=Panagrolaimus sp. PS1159 TaxID=55785 RepID=A0AC35EXL2_9BILA
MIIRKFNLFFIIFVWSSFWQITFGCSGSAQFAAARTRALAAANLDSEMRAAKCERADFGIYKAHELRALAKIYEGPSARNLASGGRASCTFDSETEGCSWFSSATFNTENVAEFNRARFETTLDYQRFDCTSDRTFPFTDFFLLAGGEERVGEGSAMLETIIPCQIGKGILKFDYWINNETPVLKICIVPEENGLPNCEESKLDINPLTFEIPGNEKPFRIRIQIDFIGSNDIILLDNIDYEAQFCEIVNPLVEAEKVKAEGSTSSIPDSNALQHGLPPLNGLIPIETTTVTLSVTNELQIDQNNLLEPEEIIPNSREILPDPALLSQREILGIQNSSETKMDACKALVCNFNYGDACFYRLSGLASTAAWQVSKTFLGNPHTGIHKPNPKDNSSGFVYVGLDGNDFSSEVFVLESSRFKLREPVYLFFDVYQRSMGIQLKVCINGFEDCPYSNPPLKAKEFWLQDQQVYLSTESEKIYFLASKVRQNLYLAIDNIRLQTIDGQSYCPSIQQQPEKLFFD